MIRFFFKKLFKYCSRNFPSTAIRCYFLRCAGYVVGKDVYIPSSLLIADLASRRENVIFGDRVSIGPNVIIITDSSPNKSRLNAIYPLVSKDVNIGSDVWIGANVTILPGVSIGKCSVIGSGSVVTKDIPSFSVAVGIPAVVVKEITI